MKRIFFPNLNGLRFIAAFMVIIHHIEQLKYLFGMPNYWETSFIHNIGKLGVVLFFVLSGFLITYLLLEERRATNTISIKDFYIRRILRIWALYYLVVIAGLFIFPRVEFLNIPNLSESVYEDFGLKVLLYLLFLPNLATIIFPAIPFISQAWSIGVEEQFYLFQPLLVKKFKNLPLTLCAIGFLYFTIKWLLIYAVRFNPNYYLDVLNNFWQTLNFDCFAIGGLAAVALYKNMRVLKILFSKVFEISILLATILLILKGVTIPFIHYELYSVLFAVIILNLAANKETILNLENPVFAYLGKISYGIYMYHVLAIVIVIKALLLINLESTILIYIFSVLLTVLISSLSYQFYEHKFITLKSKFSKIISGDSVKERRA